MADIDENKSYTEGDGVEKKWGMEIGGLRTDIGEREIRNVKVRRQREEVVTQ